MPINKYFKGHGKEVMANMKKEYGDKKGEQVFYAKSNKDKNKAKTRSARISKNLKAGKSPLGFRPH